MRTQVHKHNEPHMQQYHSQTVFWLYNNISKPSVLILTILQASAYGNYWLQQYDFASISALLWLGSQYASVQIMLVNMVVQLLDRLHDFSLHLNSVSTLEGDTMMHSFDSLLPIV